MRRLHILRRKDDAYAWEIARLQAGHPDTEVIVLLLHDAVFSSPQADLKVFACKDDLLARGLEGRFPALDYPEIVQLIFECDTIHTW